MGCKTLWDRWNGPGVPNCTTGEQYRCSSLYAPLSRRYDSILESLSTAETREIARITNCMKPCKYKKYIIVGERQRTSFKSDNFTFSLWAVSKNTEVKTEELIYPLSSLVADFGGTLGLFLGFSFMTLWDKIQLLEYDLRELRIQLANASSRTLDN